MPRAAQAAGVAFLPSEWAVSLEIARRAALGTVGVVGAAGCRRRPARGQRGAAEVVAVQMVERAAPLDRDAQTAEGELGGEKKLSC